MQPEQPFSGKYDACYDRKAVTAGIAHIGVGNFHRSHQACYLDQYLCQTQELAWGICGISLLEADRAFIRELQSQQGLYSLTTFEAAGTASTRIVGSIMEVLFAPDDAAAVIEKLSSPAIKIVTLTITEAGYLIDLRTGSFASSHPGVVHDVANPAQPQTVFGYVVAALRNRYQRGIAPFTIVSCDNFPHNGAAAQKAFGSFAALVDPELATWITQHVCFPNSMVDRITPAVKPDNKQLLNELTGLNDKVPVYAEDFRQWVVEDTFSNGRPAWEQVGVQMTADVAPYEDLKLKLLNASHSMLAYPAFLSGYAQVDEAMRDEVLRAYLQAFMDEDITPLLAPPAGTDLTAYKASLLERFANAAIGDQLARLCFDGASKLPVFLLPSLTQILARRQPLHRPAFLIAAYGHYLASDTTETGMAYLVNEPHLDPEDWRLARDPDVLRLLDMTLFGSTPARADAGFRALYAHYRHQLATQGVIQTLRELPQTQLRLNG